MVLADVLKRWQQINGKQALLCTGTDEYGMKVQQAAAKEGMPPKEFCDNNSRKFKELAAAADISNDFFVRTTDEDHKHAVEHFWSHLKNTPPENLGLYKGHHEGWYCVSDECFYAEDEVQSAVVSQTGRKIMASIESGNEVEWIKEDTWFFPLSKYKDQLLRFYDENPDWIKPTHRMNEVRNWVENHLEDLSITRPASRLSWGIPDPEDSSNTIYVWVDALVNYATKAGLGSEWNIGSPDTGLWPADVQVIGKDILRFHAIYWPAMLMAVGLPLPKKLICHNHWTMSNRKMSKSLGNVVNPNYALQRWGIDPLRYFLMRNGSFTKDMGYSNEFIMAVYEKELAANIGNVFQRIALVKKQKWSTLEAVEYAQRGFDIAQLEALPQGPTYMSLEPYLEKVPLDFCEQMNEVDLSGAIREIFQLLIQVNRFITDTEPWKLTWDETPEGKMKLNWVIYKCVDALRIAGILLQPIMPSKSAELLDGLGVKPDRRTVEFAAKGKDVEFGVESKLRKHSGRDRLIAKWESMFPPVPGVELLDEDALTGLPMPKISRKKRIRKESDVLTEEARTNNEAAIATSKALLVPYEAHHVRQYHAWMQDPHIQEATASEPMTLDEEFENQQSWRTSSDKLTFIICAPASDEAVVKAGVADADGRMRGDINFFLYPHDDDDDDDDGWCTGEVDVMIASTTDRGRGVGQAAVCALLVYLRAHVDEVMGEYAAGSKLKSLMVKIKEGNAGSRALFQKLGFVQKGEVNYFGEVVLVILWEDVVATEWWEGAEQDYREVRYEIGGV
ncbi:putative methionine--tRNA ligase, mitochondrial [Neonectria ditissima]|uniref:Probable methionine--tRNA ligase, mitochondrial n=1 Tax=Neonectria ditissima TaxID=78410 RepID=A0A0N8H6F2_9HYPO|nr:putative methionine--tRNA ligase, mitochondrial [Neonectria ditissima]